MQSTRLAVPADLIAGGGREKPPDEEPTPSVTDMSVAPGEPGPEGEAEDALADLPGDRDESTAARGSQCAARSWNHDVAELGTCNALESATAV